jgi:hypothetical protein
LHHFSLLTLWGGCAKVKTRELVDGEKGRVGMAQPKFNSWDFGAPNYQPDAFFTGSRDRNKERAYMPRLSFPALLQEEVRAIVASRVFPAYRTEEDFHRDALVHRLHWANEQLGNEHLEQVLDRHYWHEAHERRRLSLEMATQTVTSAEEILTEWGGDPQVKAEELADIAQMLASGHYQGELAERLEALVRRYGQAGLRPVQ